VFLVPLSKAEQQKLKEIIKVLSGIKGVKHSFYLTKEMREGLVELERKYPSVGPLTVQNEGILACLRSEHVACIIKDKTFRGPPHPTVVLVNDRGEVIGRELLPGEKQPKGPGKTLMLGQDFVVFADKRASKGARFVLPPVPFKEVEEMSGTSSVKSSSPSTPGDSFLRKKARLEDDPKLASILIGFDLS
jgi:hypothetical protein